MKRSALIIAALFTLSIVGLSRPAPAPQGPAFNPEGVWLGSLSINGMELRIVFKIVRSADGTLKATMDSPDQGAKDIPTDTVKVEGDRLLIEAKAIRGSYSGLYNAAAQEIEGTWTQTVSLPLKLKRVNKVPELNRPQTPKRPFPYNEEQVSYENKKAGIKLAGTLTRPQNGGPFPAALLITGSGAQDRDETIFGHKPFMVIADDLTRRGLAVLRVDDRGVGGSTGNFSTSTSEDFAGDVLAGIEFLKSRPDIDPRRIGLIGHSEGGMIAPMIAAKSPDVAFIVLLAGTGVTGEKILYEQGALIARAEGATEEAIAKALDAQKKTFALVKQIQDSKAAEEKLKPLLAATYQAMTEEQKKAVGSEELWIKGQVQAVNSHWFRFFLSYDPQPTLAKVKCPVLAMGGSKDLQVPAAENLKAIEAGLKAGGNKNYRTVEMPGLNHLFQTAKTGGVSEYAKSEETISPAALKVLGDWIESVTGLKK